MAIGAESRLPPSRARSRELRAESADLWGGAWIGSCVERVSVAAESTIADRPYSQMRACRLVPACQRSLPTTLPGRAYSGSMGADQTVDCIVRLVTQRDPPPPQHLRMDNGPELIAWSLRDWCRLTGTGTLYIEPGSPSENPWIESFNGRARDELLNINELGSLTDNRRPYRHRGLEDRTQHLATPLQPRRPHPRRVRCQMHPPTPAGPPITT